MKKLTQEASVVDFWESVERAAASAKKMPAWMKAGVDVNPEHFETSPPAVQARSTRRK